MKRLWIWIIFSLVLHFLLFRFVSLRDKPFEQHEAERYEVTLLYYVRKTGDLEKEKPEKGRKKNPEKRIIEKKTEENAEEAKPEEEVVSHEEDEKISQEAFNIKAVKEEIGAIAETIEAEKEVRVTQNREEFISRIMESDQVLDLTPVIAGLRERIMKELVYPYIARKKGLQGVVYVTLRLDARGNLLDIQVAKSSGHKSLDNAAVQLVQKVVPYSHNLGKPLSLQIPIRYSLIN